MWNSTAWTAEVDWDHGVIPSKPAMAAFSEGMGNNGVKRKRRPSVRLGEIGDGRRAQQKRKKPTAAVKSDESETLESAAALIAAGKLTKIRSLVHFNDWGSFHEQNSSSNGHEGFEGAELASSHFVASTAPANRQKQQRAKNASKKSRNPIPEHSGRPRPKASLGKLAAVLLSGKPSDTNGIPSDVNGMPSNVYGMPIHGNDMKKSPSMEYAIDYRHSDDDDHDANCIMDCNLTTSECYMVANRVSKWQEIQHAKGRIVKPISPNRPIGACMMCRPAYPAQWVSREIVESRSLHDDVLQGRANPWIGSKNNKGEPFETSSNPAEGKLLRQCKSRALHVGKHKPMSEAYGNTGLLNDGKTKLMHEVNGNLENRVPANTTTDQHSEQMQHSARQCSSLLKGVRGWLHELGLSKYAQQFKTHEVDTEVLPFLTIDDLKEMGITAVGSRRKMFYAIQQLPKGK